MRQEERGFSFSDPNVGVLHQFLALPHEALRRLPQRLRSQPHFGWKLRAPVEVRADVLGEILPTPRAYVRPATERIGGEFHGPEAEESAVTRVAFLARRPNRHIDRGAVALVRRRYSQRGQDDLHFRTVRCSDIDPSAVAINICDLAGNDVMHDPTSDAGVSGRSG